MKYRIVKKATWWTSIFTTGAPQYLYYNFDLESFEVSSYQVARRHKWEYNKGEIDLISKEDGFDAEFSVESVREGESIDGV